MTRQLLRGNHLNRHKVIAANNHGIAVADSLRNIIANNQVHDNGADGIVESGTADYNIIVGNQCYDNTGTNLTVIGANSINANNLV